MARGAGIVEGWPAIGWVVGTGFVLLSTAGVFLGRVLFARRRARLETYRATPAVESDDAFRCAMLAIAWVDLYVWVLLVTASMIVGAVASAIGERRRT
ncbi:MAG: hypothetical protein IPJ34_29005 [Myxococcales bacterium]|nr:hypothetical protein [Myxococcales bacterium]